MDTVSIAGCHLLLSVSRVTIALTPRTHTGTGPLDISSIHQLSAGVQTATTGYVHPVLCEYSTKTPSTQAAVYSDR